MEWTNTNTFYDRLGGLGRVNCSTGTYFRIQTPASVNYEKYDHSQFKVHDIIGLLVGGDPLNDTAKTEPLCHRRCTKRKATPCLKGPFVSAAQLPK